MTMITYPLLNVNNSLNSAGAFEIYQRNLVMDDDWIVHVVDSPQEILDTTSAGFLKSTIEFTNVGQHFKQLFQIHSYHTCCNLYLHGL